MYKERHKKIGEEFNPFTNSYEKVYSSDVEKIWVQPRVKTEKIVSNYKAICSGNIIEFWEYEEPVFYGFDNNSNDTRIGKKKIDNIDDFVKRKDNFLRTKFKIRRLINANVNDNSKFITLTFKENLTDVDVAKYKFKKFIEKINRRRLKEFKDKLKYLYVIEFQKRGSIHFHCVFFNQGYIKNDELFKIWKHGFTKINKIDNVDNVGAYVVKYLDKEIQDSRLIGKDLYGRSKGNLIEPLVIKRPQEVRRLFEVYKNKICYENTYNSDYNGNIKYFQVNLKR